MISLVRAGEHGCRRDDEVRGGPTHTVFEDACGLHQMNWCATQEHEEGSAEKTTKCRIW
jgi:hypothetical protein